MRDSPGFETLSHWTEMAPVRALRGPSLPSLTVHLALSSGALEPGQAVPSVTMTSDPPY